MIGEEVDGFEGEGEGWEPEDGNGVKPLAVQPVSPARPQAARKSAQANEKHLGSW